MKYCYWLPDEDGNKIEQETDHNSVIVIGANGAGKSHLGAWIEQQDMHCVHRIAAQRNLNFKDDIPLTSYSHAEDMVMYGTPDTRYQELKIHKWGSKEQDEYTTRMVNDFDNVLSALLAIRNNEANQYLEACKKAEGKGNNKPEVPITILDKLYFIWNDIFPHREISMEDSKFNAKCHYTETYSEYYPATKMSDGERSVLYFAAQVLCVPEHKILIIDEPELHLHRSLINRLWSTLEKYRQDCLFIYITHDTQFAADHGNADVIWIKEYDGYHKWQYEIICGDDLPEDMLLELLGSRKPILFVEGNKNSYDTQLYRAVYKDYYVVPCGSCTQVISRTKVFRNNQMLHHNTVYGIIDRDYRSDYELEQYESDGIYALEVAEVENLFITEEMIKASANQMGTNADEAFDKTKDYVLNTKFNNMINTQICQAVVAEIKYLLTTANISIKNDAEAQASLEHFWNGIDYDAIRTKIADRFQGVQNSNDYAQVLKVFNEKGLAKNVGQFIEGIDKKGYCQFVINQVNVKNKSFISALEKYLPSSDKIPRIDAFFTSIHC